MRHVYFASDGAGHIKIGISENPAARVAGLQTGSVRKLSILLTLVGDDADERWLHEQFAFDRVAGEWFSTGGGDNDGGLWDFVWFATDEMFHDGTWTIKEVHREWLDADYRRLDLDLVIYDPLEWANAAQVA